jgi:predicted DNA-binding protein
MAERIEVIRADIEGFRVALSVRLDPALEARVEEESKRLGISKSDLVKDALELRLGLKNPYDLLRQVRSGRPMGRPDASERTGAALKARLRAKRSD